MIIFKGGSPGLVVMGDDSCSIGMGSNPSAVYWMDIFSHWFVGKDQKLTKRGQVWPILKKNRVKTATFNGRVY